MVRQPMSGRNQFRPAFDILEERTVPTVTIYMIPDPANGAMTDLRIVGDGNAQNITITDNENSTQNAIGVNTNGERTVIRSSNGTVIATAPTGLSGTGPAANNGFFTNVSALEIQLKGGNDTLTYTLLGWDAGNQSRSISVDMGAGNDSFTLNAAGTTITGANLAVNYVGGIGNDALTETFQAIDNSKVILTGNAGYGNDTATITFNGVINGATGGSSINNTLAMGEGNDSVSVTVGNSAANVVAQLVNIDQGSTVTNSVDLGNGTNTFSYNQGSHILANSAVNLNLTGGVLNDFASVALNNSDIDAGHFNLTGDLGWGNDMFNASYGPTFQITGAGASASINVNGNYGNDTIGVNQTGAAVSPATGPTIAGLLDINLQGGPGKDVISATTPATGGMVLTNPGNYRLRIDGGDGADTIGVTLSNTADSTGNYDIAINGGNNPDAVTFSIDTAAATVTFNPNNQILLDGGLPVPASGQVNNTLRLHNPNDAAPITILNFGSVVNF